MARKMKIVEKKYIELLINHLMRCGKKSFAYDVVYSVGLILSQHFNRSIHQVYSKVFQMLRPYVEVRKVRVRRTTYMVPFPITRRRQRYLTAKWLFSTLRQNSIKASMWSKFGTEVSKILYNTSNVFDKKYDEYQRAEKSRSFTHFRWY